MTKELIAKPKTLLEKVVYTSAIVLGSIVLFYGLQLFVSILIITALSLAGNNSEQIQDLVSENAGVQFLYSLIAAALLLLVLRQLLRWRKIAPLQYLRLQTAPKLGQLGEVVLMYGVYFIVLIIATVVVSQTTTVDVNQSQDLGAVAREGWGLVMTFVSLVIIAPIIEEVLFRGVLFRSIKHVSGRIAGYIIVCLLFGAAHLEFDNLNFIAAIDTLIFSGFLIYVYEKHQSLYSAIALHALKNGIAFIALFVIV